MNAVKGWVRNCGGSFGASVLGLAVVALMVPLIQAFQGSNGSLGQSIPLLFLVPVLVASTLGGRAAGALVGVAAVLAWDWFFIPPLYHITVATAHDVVALLVFLGIALLTGQLATTVRAAARQATRRARSTEAMYELSVALIARKEMSETMQSITRRLQETFNLEACAVLLPGGATLWRTASVAGTLPDRFAAERSREVSACAAWAAKTGSICGLAEHDGHTDASRGPRPRDRSRVRFLPLRIGDRTAGVLQLVQSPGVTMDADQEQLLTTLANGLAVALEQERLAEEERGAIIAQESDRLKSVLLSSVSHDLRTPLAGIKAAASSLLQKDVHWTEDDREAFLSDINTEADRLNRLVSNLLDLSRIEAGALRPAKEWEDIGELIRGVVTRMKPALEGHDVVMNVPPGLPPVSLDAVQIEQVVSNLLENAARYSPPGAPITVDVAAGSEPPRMTIAVTDKGEGIDAHLHQRIFDKFYRVSAGANRSKGTGMGLAIVKGLVEAHGGTVEVSSAQGHGSTFTVTLPLSSREPRASDATSRRAQESVL